jgi:hypothetical protein
MFYSALNSAKNSISSNRKDNFKSRLTNGISMSYQPEIQTNFLAHVKRSNGFKTSLPGLRFNSVENNPMSILPVPKSRLLTQTANLYKN